MSESEPAKPTVPQAVQILDNYINVELERQSCIVSNCWDSLKKALDIHNGNSISDSELLDGFGAATLLESAVENFPVKANEVVQVLDLIRQARQLSERND
jgi:hypothetical protein